jgi:hypothetical protein
MEDLLRKYSNYSSTAKVYSIKVYILFCKNWTWASPCEKRRITKYDKPLPVNRSQEHIK